MNFLNQAGLNEGAERYGATNADLFSCTICGAKHIISDFRTEVELQEHLKSWHGRDTENDGYDAKTSTTAARTKRTVKQKFYTTKNMACPACDKEEGGISALKEHLEDDHDMTEAEAEEVIGAWGRYDNAADVYVPPLLSLKQRIADGQKQYGDLKK